MDRYFSPRLLNDKSYSKSLGGRLDGLVILRFTHAEEAVGGIEHHLKDLNTMLLMRNKMTIIQTIIVDSNNEVQEEVDHIGKGTLIIVKVPLKKMAQQKPVHGRLKNLLDQLKIKEFIRDFVIYDSFFSSFFRKFIRKDYAPGSEYEAGDAGTIVRGILDRTRVDLVVLHYAGGKDSYEAINEAKRKSIPYLFSNHFNNNQLRHMSIREQVSDAAGVGVASTQNIPKYIKSRYMNLSDGIDTEFYHRDYARPVSPGLDSSAVILPARIIPGKGHRDVISAAHRLKRDGVRLKLIFTGEPNLPDFKMNLDRLIDRYEMAEDVLFVGQLTFEELRDWYASSKVVVVPSVSEGLPRVVLEAQAMKTPVIAYKVGGIPEALIDGETGYLVRKGDIRGLSERMKELLSDEHKRVQMGEAGRKLVEEKFSIPALVARHEDWYLNAI